MVKRKGWSQTMFFGGEGGQIPSQDIYFSSPKIFYLFIISTTFLRLFIKFWNHFHHCWPYISERYHHRQIALKCFNFLSTFIFREQILLEIMFKAVAIGVDGARLCLFWRSKFWFVAFESLFWLYTVKSAQSWYQWRDIQPSMLTHTRNSCSAFTHPKCTHRAVNTHTHREHTPGAVGSHLCWGAQGAVVGSVPCSRALQSWYWRWRERWTFTPPTYYSRCAETQTRNLWITSPTL